MVGFLLSSVFLSTFVHPTASVSITEDNSSWVGAWWMGLAIGSAFAFLIGIILTGMPKIIKKEDHNRSTVNEANRKAEVCCRFNFDIDLTFKGWIHLNLI